MVGRWIDDIQGQRDSLSMKEPGEETRQSKVGGEDGDCHTDHESWRVALYYYYTAIEDEHEQVDFQKTLCESLSLNGRIRVSSEGINAVLTGLHSNLQVYEEKVKEELQRLKPGPNEKIDLDLKYCLLREDLPSKRFVALFSRFENLLFSYSVCAGS